MKTRILALILLAGFSAIAGTNYECRSPEGTEAYLSFAQQNVTWSDRTHSASSQAQYAGIEKAPFSAEKGYWVFKLTDFFQTNDSSFFLKIEPDFRQKAEFKVVEGLDNDGHDESISYFVCKKSLNQ